MAHTFPDLATNAFGSKTFIQVIEDFRSFGLEVKVMVSLFPPTSSSQRNANKAVPEAAGMYDFICVLLNHPDFSSIGSNDVGHIKGGRTEGGQSAIHTFGVSHRTLKSLVTLRIIIDSHCSLGSPWADEPTHSTATIGTSAVTA